MAQEAEERQHFAQITRQAQEQASQIEKVQKQEAQRLQGLAQAAENFGRNYPDANPSEIAALIQDSGAQTGAELTAALEAAHAGSRQLRIAAHKAELIADWDQDEFIQAGYDGEHGLMADAWDRDAAAQAELARQFNPKAVAPKATKDDISRQLDSELFGPEKIREQGWADFRRGESEARGVRSYCASDPPADRGRGVDASWGHRSAVSTRKGGGFYGYRIHAAVCSVTGLPLAWQVETARSHESNYVAPLLDTVRARGFTPATVAMDMGYDNGRVYAECAERNVVPIIPLRKNSGHRESSIPRNGDEWRSLYRRRSAVEREFGRLKHEYGLAFLRVRRIERVRLHADLVMLGRLSLALAKARTVSLAA